MESMIVLHLQNLPRLATNVDIRQFFVGLDIPEGGVHIIGGEEGDAFIHFRSEDDLLQACLFDNQPLLGQCVKLLLAKEVDVQRVLDKRSQELERARSVKPSSASTHGDNDRETQRRYSISEDPAPIRHHEMPIDETQRFEQAVQNLLHEEREAVDRAYSSSHDVGTSRKRSLDHSSPDHSSRDRDSRDHGRRDQRRSSSSSTSEKRKKEKEAEFDMSLPFYALSEKWHEKKSATSTRAAAPWNDNKKRDESDMPPWVGSTDMPPWLQSTDDFEQEDRDDRKRKDTRRNSERRESRDTSDRGRSVDRRHSERSSERRSESERREIERSRRSSRERHRDRRTRSRSRSPTKAKPAARQCVALYNLDLTVTATDIRKFLKFWSIIEGGILLRTDKRDANVLFAYVTYVPRDDLQVRTLNSTGLNGKTVEVRDIPLERFKQEKERANREQRKSEEDLEEQREKEQELAKLQSQPPPNYPQNYPQNYPSNYPQNYPQNYPPNYPQSYPQNYPHNYPPQGNPPQTYQPPAMYPGHPPHMWMPPRPPMHGMPPMSPYRPPLPRYGTPRPYGPSPPGPWGPRPGPYPPAPRGPPPSFPAVPPVIFHYIELNKLPLDVTAFTVWGWFGAHRGRSDHVVLAKDRNEYAVVAYVAFHSEMIRDGEIKRRSELKGKPINHADVHNCLLKMDDSVIFLQSNEKKHDKDITHLIRSRGPMRLPEDQEQRFRSGSEERERRARRSESREKGPRDWSPRLTRSRSRSLSRRRSRSPSRPIERARDRRRSSDRFRRRNDDRRKSNGRSVKAETKTSSGKAKSTDDKKAKRTDRKSNVQPMKKTNNITLASARKDSGPKDEKAKRSTIKVNQAKNDKVSKKSENKPKGVSKGSDSKTKDDAKADGKDDKDDKKVEVDNNDKQGTTEGDNKQENKNDSKPEGGDKIDVKTDNISEKKDVDEDLSSELSLSDATSDIMSSDLSLEEDPKQPPKDATSDVLSSDLSLDEEDPKPEPQVGPDLANKPASPTGEIIVNAKNFPIDISEQDAFKFFTDYNPVEDSTRKSWDSNGTLFVHVKFQTVDEADKAVKELDQKEYTVKRRGLKKDEKDTEELSVIHVYRDKVTK